ncbi:hypothetical protein OPT61_g4777 [Boeremia exigua]|uniref:Uncharacterized protein n=1 Tax=Boeremia exigua TaxID=749465 RepID=A0ACC2ICX1_9PLEO|nr:hypothetical protein OPT61_g4777 [Boeremia exigua]
MAASQSPNYEYSPVEGQSDDKAGSKNVHVGTRSVTASLTEKSVQPTARPRGWTSAYLRRTTLLGFVVAFFCFLLVVIALAVVDAKQGGIANAKSNEHYLWTYGPTAALWGSLRKSHWPVAITITNTFLITLVTVASTGLLVLQRTPFVRHNCRIDVTDSFVTSFDTSTIGSAPVLATLAIQNGTIPFPPGTSRNGAFENLAPPASLSGSADVEVEGLTSAFHGGLDCEVATVQSGTSGCSDWQCHAINVTLAITTPTCDIRGYNLTSGCEKRLDAVSCDLEAIWGVTCDSHADGHDKLRLVFMIGQLYQDLGGASKNESEALKVVTDNTTTIVCEAKYNITDTSVIMDRNGNLKNTSSNSVATIRAKQFPAWDLVDGLLTASDAAGVVLKAAYSYSSYNFFPWGSFLQFFTSWTHIAHPSSDLKDPNILQSHANEMFSMATAQMAKQSLMQPSADTTLGTCRSIEDRLRIRGLSLYLMGATLGILMLSTLGLLCIAPQQYSSRDSSSMGGLALVLSRSPALLSRFSSLACTDLKTTKRQLDNVQCQSLLAQHDQGWQLVVDLTSPEASGTEHTCSATASPSGPTYWRPLSLRPVSKVLVTVVLLVLVVVLEVLYSVSRKNNGLTEVNPQRYERFAWAYIPAMVMLTVQTLIGMIAFSSLMIFPYFRLRSKATNTRSDILRNYASEMAIKSLWSSIAAKHVIVACMALALLLAPLLTIAVSGLYTAQVTGTEIPVTMFIRDQLNASFLSVDIPTIGSDLYRTSANNIGLLLTQNFTFPQWTFDELAFPEASFDFPAGMSTGELIGSNITTMLPGIRSDLSCEIAASVPTNFTDTLGQSRWRKANVAAFEALGVYEDDSTDIFWPSSGGNPFGFFSLCGRDNQRDPKNTFCGALGTSEVNWKAFTCSSVINQLGIAITMDVSTLTIIAAAPDESTSRLFSNQTLTSGSLDSFPSSMVPSLFGSADFGGQTSVAGYFDPAFQAVVYGLGTHDSLDNFSVDKYLNSDGIKEIVAQLQHIHRTITAQSANLIRIPLNTTSLLAPPGTVNATLMDSHRYRLHQSLLSTRILDGLLVTIALCIALSFCLMDTRKVLPKNPTSIAAGVSLIAKDARMLQSDVLPEGAQWYNDSELETKRAWDGLFFRLGWWDGGEPSEHIAGVVEGIARLRCVACYNPVTLSPIHDCVSERTSAKLCLFAIFNHTTQESIVCIMATTSEYHNLAEAAQISMRIRKKSKGGENHVAIRQPLNHPIMMAVVSNANVNATLGVRQTIPHRDLEASDTHPPPDSSRPSLRVTLPLYDPELKELDRPDISYPTLSRFDHAQVSQDIAHDFLHGYHEEAEDLYDEASSNCNSESLVDKYEYIRRGRSSYQSNISEFDSDRPVAHHAHTHHRRTQSLPPSYDRTLCTYDLDPFDGHIIDEDEHKDSLISSLRHTSEEHILNPGIHDEPLRKLGYGEGTYSEKDVYLEVFSSLKELDAESAQPVFDVKPLGPTEVTRLNKARARGRLRPTTLKDHLAADDEDAKDDNTNVFLKWHDTQDIKKYARVHIKEPYVDPLRPRQSLFHEVFVNINDRNARREPYVASRNTPPSPLYGDAITLHNVSSTAFRSRLECLFAHSIQQDPEYLRKLQTWLRGGQELWLLSVPYNNAVWSSNLNSCSPNQAGLLAGLKVVVENQPQIFMLFRAMQHTATNIRDDMINSFIAQQYYDPLPDRLLVDPSSNNPYTAASFKSINEVSSVHLFVEPSFQDWSDYELRTAAGAFYEATWADTGSRTTYNGTCVMLPVQKSFRPEARVYMVYAVAMTLSPESLKNPALQKGHRLKVYIDSDTPNAETSWTATVWDRFTWAGLDQVCFFVTRPVEQGEIADLRSLHLIDPADVDRWSLSELQRHVKKVRQTRVTVKVTTNDKELKRRLKSISRMRISTGLLVNDPDRAQSLADSQQMFMANEHASLPRIGIYDDLELDEAVVDEVRSKLNPEQMSVLTNMSDNGMANRTGIVTGISGSGKSHLLRVLGLPFIGGRVQTKASRNALRNRDLLDLQLEKNARPDIHNPTDPQYENLQPGPHDDTRPAFDDSTPGEYNPNHLIVEKGRSLYVAASNDTVQALYRSVSRDAQAFNAKLNRPPSLIYRRHSKPTEITAVMAGMSKFAGADPPQIFDHDVDLPVGGNNEKICSDYKKFSMGNSFAAIQDERFTDWDSSMASKVFELFKEDKQQSRVIKAAFTPRERATIREHLAPFHEVIGELKTAGKWSKESRKIVTRCCKVVFDWLDYKADVVITTASAAMEDRFIRHRQPHFIGLEEFGRFDDSMAMGFFNWGPALGDKFANPLFHQAKYPLIGRLIDTGLNVPDMKHTQRFGNDELLQLVQDINEDASITMLPGAERTLE